MVWIEETNNKIITKFKLLLNFYTLYSSKTHVTSSLLFYQFISNIQEIIDIICMFLCLFIIITNDQEKRK